MSLLASWPFSAPVSLLCHRRLTTSTPRR
jgi:hypothetical protein